MRGRLASAAAILILFTLTGACMKAERLGTDTNSPDGFLVGQLDLGGLAGGSSSPTYTISGIITGYTGSGMVLQNNAGDNLAVAQGANSFAFPSGLSAGSTYSVTVSTPPGNPPQTCSVTGGSGTMSTAPITGVTVACSNSSWSATTTVNLMGNAVSQSPEIRAGIDDLARPHIVTIDATTVSTITTQRLKALTLSGSSWITTMNNGWVSANFNHLDFSIGPTGKALAAVRSGSVTPTEAYLSTFDPAVGWVALHVASGASSNAYFPRVGVAADGNGFAIIGDFTSNILPRSFSGGGFQSGSFLSPAICGGAYGSALAYAPNGVVSLACGEENNTYFRVYTNSPSEAITAWHDVTPPTQGSSVMHYGQRIAVNPSGDILVAGVDLYTPTKLYTTVRRNGTWGAQTTASTALLFSYGTPDHFDTAMDATGNAVTVWSDTSNKVFARFWNTTAQTWTSLQIASLAGAPVHGPMVAISPDGYGFIAVSATAFIYLFRVDLRDQTFVPLGTISTSDAQSQVHIAVNSRGQAVLAWTDYGVGACGGSGTPYCIKARTLIQ